MARSFVSRFAVRGRPGMVAVGVIAAVLMVGCGSSGPKASNPSSSSRPATSSVSSVVSSTPAVAGVDACSLVSESEASAIVGEPVSRAATSTPVHCDFVGQSNNTSVVVTVRTTTATEFDTRCANGSAFPGIGDAACGAPKAFLLRKGTTEVDFSATTILGANQVMMNFSVLAKTLSDKL